MKIVFSGLSFLLLFLLVSCSSGSCKNPVTSETVKENEKISTQQMKSKTYNQMRKDWENQQ